MAISGWSIEPIARAPLASDVTPSAGPTAPALAPTDSAPTFADAFRQATATTDPAPPTPSAGSEPGSSEFGLSRAIAVVSAIRDAQGQIAVPPAGTAPPPPRAPSVAPAAVTPAAGGAAADRRVASARGEIGVSEAPPGSNDGPRIAQYRTAVPGGPVGRWCAYFVSWVARQAGTPLGDRGQGFAAVEGIRGWLQAKGRLAPGSADPRAGDLVFFDGNRDGRWDHVGLVESVLPDGRVQTIEGNSSDAVRRRVRTRAEIVAFGQLA